MELNPIQLWSKKYSGIPQSDFSSEKNLSHCIRVSSFVFARANLPNLVPGKFTKFFHIAQWRWNENNTKRQPKKIICLHGTSIYTSLYISDSLTLPPTLRQTRLSLSLRAASSFSSVGCKRRCNCDAESSLADNRVSPRWLPNWLSLFASYKTIEVMPYYHIKMP